MHSLCLRASANLHMIPVMAGSISKVHGSALAIALSNFLSACAVCRYVCIVLTADDHGEGTSSSGFHLL